MPFVQTTLLIFLRVALADTPFLSKAAQAHAGAWKSRAFRDPKHFHGIAHVKEDFLGPSGTLKSTDSAALSWQNWIWNTNPSIYNKSYFTISNRQLKA